MRKEYLLTGIATGLAMLSLAISINRGKPVIVRAHSSKQIEYIQNVLTHIEITYHLQKGRRGKRNDIHNNNI